MEKQGWTWRAWMLYSALLVVVLNPPLHLSTGPAWPAHGCIRRAQVIPDYLAPIRVSLLLDCRYCSIGGAALSAMQAVVQRLSSAGGARAASSRWLATAARPVARSPLNMPADMAPSKVGPKWRRPRVSRRKAATMRKAALVNGTYGSWDAATGALRGGSYSAAPRTSCATPLPTGTGWDPAWDPTPMAGVARPPKGRRHEKAKPERCVVGRGFETAGPRARPRPPAHSIAKIQAALAEMDKKIADYKKVRPSSCHGTALRRMCHIPRTLAQSRPARLRKDSVVALLSKKDPWER